MRLDRWAPFLFLLAACAGEATVADPVGPRSEPLEKPAPSTGAVAAGSPETAAPEPGNRALQIPSSLRGDRRTIETSLPPLAAEQRHENSLKTRPEVAVEVVDRPEREPEPEPEPAVEAITEDAPVPGSFELLERRVELSWSEELEQWHAVFEFANPGDDEIQITEIGVSCGCLAPQITLYDVRYPDEPILRGSAAAPIRIPGGGFGQVDVRVRPDETFDSEEEFYTTFRIGADPNVVLVAVAPK